MISAHEDLHWMREVYGPEQAPKRRVLTYEIISIDASRKTNTIWIRFRPDQWPDVKAYFLKSSHPEHYYIREVETNKFVRFMDAVNRDRIRAETGQNRE